MRALAGVDLDLRAGEVLALVGENGAGKSTLMKVLSGVYPTGSYSGELMVRGKAQHFASPADAEAAGIAIIHQELSSFLHLSVAENLFVGAWPLRRASVIDWPELYKQAKHWLALVGLDIAPETPMRELSVGAQQLVEIAKALARESEILILDEPTSALTDQEVERLFTLLQNLRSQGKALVYISHKLEEVYALADRITVLRDGRTVHTEAAKTLSRDRLVALMVGREITRLFPEPAIAELRILPKVTLKADKFLGRKGGRLAFGPVSFELRAGEILGLAGLLGSGRSELLRAIAGSQELTCQGELALNGAPWRSNSPRAAISGKVFYVSEDRKLESILPIRSLTENEGLSRRMLRFLGLPVNSQQEFAQARSGLKKLRTKYARLDQPIQSLSGGNQQKVVLARALSTEPNVILLDEPTRGVDVGAKFEIYEILFELAQAGKSLIIVSSELPELMALSDRIIVLAHGKVEGELVRKNFSQTAIMQLALGRAVS